MPLNLSKEETEFLEQLVLDEIQKVARNWPKSKGKDVLYSIQNKLINLHEPNIVNYEVDNEQIKDKLISIGTKIASDLPEGWGYTLFICKFGPQGNMFYISNADRESMLDAMQEYINKKKSKVN